MNKPTYLEGFREDIHTLVRPCQIMALQILMDVAKGEREGKPLENHLNIGDLSDCLRIRFDHDPEFQHEGEYRFRLVYRLLPNGQAQAVQVEAVAVGRRMDLAVYERAVQNLGRGPDKD